MFWSLYENHRESTELGLGVSVLRLLQCSGSHEIFPLAIFLLICSPSALMCVLESIAKVL